MNGRAERNVPADPKPSQSARTIQQDLWLIAFIFVLTMVIAGRVWSLRGWLGPIHISSGSMADSLRGPHNSIKCEACGATIVQGVEHARRDGVVVCPHCGEIGTSDRLIESAGDRVLVESLSSGKSYKRWDAVAFLDANDERGVAQVKRIVGLPGELVAIRDGDLLVDDQIARKTLDEFRQMAILVFDDSWSRSVTAGVPTGSTWEARSSRRQWRRDGDGYSFVGPNPRHAFVSGSDQEHFSGRNEELQWLEFDMRRRYLAASEQISTPMLDVYGYNQSLSRELQTAHDLLCVTRLRVNDADVTVWRLKDGQERFELWSDWRIGRLRLLHNDRLVWARNVGWLSHSTGGMIEVALVDRQVIFAVDGVTWLRYPYESTQPRNDILRTIAIGGLRGSFRVDQIRVYRDVHYLHAYGVGWPWKASRPLAEDEYFVLGDNSPASLDSRQLGGRFVVHEQILGRVWRSRLP